MLKKLAEIARDLDGAGLFREADQVTETLVRLAMDDIMENENAPDDLISQQPPDHGLYFAPGSKLSLLDLLKHERVPQRVKDKIMAELRNRYPNAQSHEDIPADMPMGSKPKYFGNIEIGLPRGISDNLSQEDIADSVMRPAIRGRNKRRWNEMEQRMNGEGPVHFNAQYFSGSGPKKKGEPVDDPFTPRSWTYDRNLTDQYYNSYPNAPRNENAVPLWQREDWDSVQGQEAPDFSKHRVRQIFPRVLNDVNFSE